MQTTSVQTDQPTVVAYTQPFLGDCPAHVVCPTCHANVITRVTPINGIMTWLFAFSLFLLG